MPLHPVLRFLSYFAGWGTAELVLFVLDPGRSHRLRAAIHILRFRPLPHFQKLTLHVLLFFILFYFFTDNRENGVAEPLAQEEVSLRGSLETLENTFQAVWFRCGFICHFPTLPGGKR